MREEHVPLREEVEIPISVREDASISLKGGVYLPFGMGCLSPLRGDPVSLREEVDISISLRGEVPISLKGEEG